MIVCVLVGAVPRQEPKQLEELLAQTGTPPEIVKNWPSVPMDMVSRESESVA